MLHCRQCLLRGLAPIFELSRSRIPARTLLRPIAADRTRQYATVRPPGRTLLTPVERAAKKQLEHTTDPYHISEYVKTMLKKGKVEDATAITKMASKNASVVVSWNHLIDHEMRQDRIHSAIRMFNDMKKRAQQPNAQTFTIIFRGLSASSHFKLAVSEAIRLYNNMLSSTRLKPNTYHMNAVIQVCAKAMDLESMFTIASSASEEDKRMPDAQTYTPIFNGIRAKIEYDNNDLKNRLESEVKSDTAPAIQQAYAVWDEIITRWRAGQLTIDELLVCSFGRVLLLGERKDQESIPALIEQTMEIPKAETAQLAQPSDTDASAIPDVKPSKGKAGLRPTRRTTTYSRAPPVFATPGEKTLALLLETSILRNQILDGMRYWGFFTKHLGIIPDSHNWTSLMRLFRKGRSSGRALAYLTNMPEDRARPAQFRIAMQTCLGDNLNPSSFKTATDLLALMNKTLREPDLQTLGLYYQTGYAAGKRTFTELAAKKPEDARQAQGKQLTEMVDKLHAIYETVRRSFDAQNLSSLVDNQEWLRRSAPLADFVALGRKILTTCDRIIFGNMVPEAVADRLKRMRNDLNKYVVAYFEERQRRDPKFRENIKEKNSSKPRRAGDRPEQRPVPADDFDAAFADLADGMPTIRLQQSKHKSGMRRWEADLKDEGEDTSLNRDDRRSLRRQMERASF